MTSIVPPRLRRSTRRGLVAVAAALCAPLVVAPHAGAGPATGGTVGHIAAAATTVKDHSIEMPRTARNETTGDFLGKGYEQRAVVEGAPGDKHLNIYDSEERGGALLRSTPTDLQDGVRPTSSRTRFVIRPWPMGWAPSPSPGRPGGSTWPVINPTRRLQLPVQDAS